MSSATALRQDVRVPPETRGQSVRRRREALRLTQADLAREANVSEPTIRNLESDRTERMRKSADVLSTLDRLEAEQGRPARASQRRRATDTPKRRAIDVVIESAEHDEDVQIRFLSDGTRAIFIVPPSGQMPSDEEIERVLRDVRGGKPDRSDEG